MQSTIFASTRDPSEVLACMGLLRLADRLWPGATGCFSDDRFLLAADDSDPAQTIMDALKDCELLTKFSDAGKAGSMALGAPFGIWCNWWRRRNGLKPWAGQQAARDTIPLLQLALPDGNADMLRFQAFLQPRGASKKPAASLGWDTWRTLTARDIGFSPDALDMGIAARPAVELLAIIGLQMCWPRDLARRNDEGKRAEAQRWQYVTWSEPRTISEARAAYKDPLEGDQRHVFGWAKRDMRGYLRGPTMELST